MVPYHPKNLLRLSKYWDRKPKILYFDPELKCPVAKMLSARLQCIHPGPDQPICARTLSPADKGFNDTAAKNLRCWFVAQDFLPWHSNYLNSFNVQDSLLSISWLSYWTMHFFAYLTVHNFGNIFTLILMCPLKQSYVRTDCCYCRISWILSKYIWLDIIYASKTAPWVVNCVEISGFLIRLCVSPKFQCRLQ